MEQNYTWQDLNGGPHSAPARSVQDVHRIQASIRANKVLSQELASKRVNVHDVINAEQAADGSITYYTE